MRITQVQMKETKDQKYSGLGGMDERDKIPKDIWKGWKIGETQGKMERMNDQEFSHLGGALKIGNTQGQLEWMEDQKWKW